MKSAFPFQPGIELKLAAPRKTAMKLRLRVPAWAAKDMPILVNGKRAVVGKPGSYAVIDRKWSDGDTVTFTLPMDFRTTRYTGVEQIANHDRYAIEYGPILMAAVGPQSPRTPVCIQHNPDQPRDWLTPQPDQPLRFSIAGDPDHFLAPYWLNEDRAFSCFPIIDRVSIIRGAEWSTVEIVSHLGSAAELRYTLDGSEPTAKSLRYKAPFRLEGTATVKVREFSGGQPLFPTTSATFLKVPLFPPTIRPTADGKKIEILAAPLFPKAALHYTLDGSEPTEKSPLYAGPMEMPADKRVIRARALVPGGGSSTEIAYVVGAEANPPLPDIYLSDLEPLKATSGRPDLGTPWDTAKKDRSASGKALMYLGKEYKKGMGVHASSELVYDIKPGYERFVVLAAIGSCPAGSGTVICEVYADTQLIAQSALLRGSQPGWFFDLPIPAGSQQLRLVVTDGGDDYMFDQVDWINAGFVTRKAVNREKT
jgi:hypothetical protein